MRIARQRRVYLLRGYVSYLDDARARCTRDDHHHRTVNATAFTTPFVSYHYHCARVAFTFIAGLAWRLFAHAHTTYLTRITLCGGGYYNARDAKTPNLPRVTRRVGQLCRDKR